jgi:hypothetical protein
LCQGEAAIGEPDFLGVFRQNLVGGFDHKSLVLGERLPAGFFDAFSHDQLMNFGHTPTSQLSVLNATWSLGAQATRR